MKRILLTLAAVICVFITAALARPLQPLPPTWEYKFLHQCDEKKTNALAQDGWELADMSMASYGSLGSATCVFKRNRQ